MGSVPQLNEGVLKDIMSGAIVELPLVQILGIKKLKVEKENKCRFRIYLNDGKYSLTFAMITSSTSFEEIGNYTIVRLKKFLKNTITMKGVPTPILLILDLEVVTSGEKVGKIIGNPEPIPAIAERDGDTTQSSAASASTTNGSNNHHHDEPMPEAPPKKSSEVVKKSAPSADVSMNSSQFSGRVCNPIASLSPYHNRWVIKARVTNKSDIRYWSNSRGEGKLFSIDLIDESGEIRLTGFKEHVDKFYDLIEIDKVYYISKCQVKIANKRFNSLKNEYEMSMVSETIIEPCEEDVADVPTVQYDFITLKEAAEKSADTIVDVIGVCKEASELNIFTAKTTNREMKKKTVMLVDQSNTAMSLTLWGQQAENFDGSNNPVIVIKGAKITEYGGGLFLSTTMSSQFKINPDVPECHRIKGWFEAEGKNVEMTNVSGRTGGNSFQTEWKSFKVVQTQGVENSERGDYYKTLATILLVRSQNAIYKACPTTDCNKKVLENNSMYRCEKCDREFPNFKYRLLVSLNLSDFSGNQWVTMFSNEAEKIFEKTSQEIGEILEENQEEGVMLFERVQYKQFVFTCRAKTEVYNDEQRLKTIVIKVDPVNYVERNTYLIKVMEERFKISA